MSDSDDSIAGLLGRAVGDATDVVRAEVDVYRQAAMVRLQRSKGALALIAASLGLAMSASTALLVGLVMALVPLVGGVAAGLIVAAGALLLAYILVRLALPRLTAVKAHPVQQSAEVVR